MYCCFEQPFDVHTCCYCEPASLRLSHKRTINNELIPQPTTSTTGSKLKTEDEKGEVKEKNGKGFVSNNFVL